METMSAYEYMQLIARKKQGEAAGPKSKYRNEKVEYDGVVFDSKREKDRYKTLKILENRGIISNLRRQVKYTLLESIKGVQREVSYRADFVYMKNGEEVVEDVKGMRTKEYILKKKMMRALLGIEIHEI